MVEGTTQEELEEIILNSKAEAEELKAEVSMRPPAVVPFLKRKS